MKSPEHQNETLIISELDQKLLRLIGLMGGESYQNWILECSQRIRQQFPDAKNYTLWHVLVGGSPIGCAHFDFGGDFSVVKIINNKLNECVKKTEN